MNPADVTLAILAGGAGQRMGQPKAHLQIHNQPILQYLLTRLHWPGPTLLITSPGREHPPAHHLFTLEASDPTPNQGPLQGLLTSLENSPTDILLLTAVDMPCIEHSHLLHLLAELPHHPTSIGLMLQRSTDTQPLIEPFPSLWRKSAAPTIRSLLSQNLRSLHPLSRHGATLLPTPQHWPPTLWTNLNHPADLNRFLA